MQILYTSTCFYSDSIFLFLLYHFVIVYLFLFVLFIFILPIESTISDVVSAI